MKFHIKHVTTYKYEPAAQRLVMRLKLFPPFFYGQKIESWAVTVNGEAIRPISRTEYGDEVALWASSGPVNDLVIEAAGIVMRQDTSGVSRDLPGRAPLAIFRRQTALTTITPAIQALTYSVTGKQGLPWLHTLNEAVAELIVYQAGSTNQSTTADQALAHGSGVCQDHAHVFIAAARHAGYAAQYVVGYLHDEESPEVATHAWAEIMVDGLGWVGFDPSHIVCPTDQYIRLGCGLDAYDAGPVRGSVSGGTELSQKATVSIRRETG